MFLYRFMSKLEFDKFINGVTLENYTEHKALTDSVGFCFGKCTGNKKDIENLGCSAQFAWQYLSGTSPQDPDIVCLFEIDDKLVGKSIKKGYGVYADPYGSFWDTIQVDEYSCTSYNNKDFRLIAYCSNFKDFNSWDYLDEDWTWNKWN